VGKAAEPTRTNSRTYHKYYTQLFVGTLGEIEDDTGVGSPQGSAELPKGRFRSEVLGRLSVGVNLSAGGLQIDPPEAGTRAPVSHGVP
jgi:hypothetical protein